MSKATALATFAQGLRVEAAEQFGNYIGENPYDIDARLWKAESHESIGDKVAALGEYNEIVIRVPGIALSVLAAVKREILADPNCRDAVAKLKKHVQQHPETAWSWYHLAKLQTGIERLASLKRAVELDPMNFWFRTNYALENDTLGNEKEAGDDFRRAVRLSKNVTFGHLGMARYALLQGDSNEAYRHFENAHSLNPLIAAKWILDDIKSTNPILRDLPVKAVVTLGVAFKGKTVESSNVDSSVGSKVFQVKSDSWDESKIMDLVEVSHLKKATDPNEGETFVGSLGRLKLVLRTAVGSGSTYEIHYAAVASSKTGSIEFKLVSESGAKQEGQSFLVSAAANTAALATGLASIVAGIGSAYAVGGSLVALTSLVIGDGVPMAPIGIGLGLLSGVGVVYAGFTKWVPWSKAQISSGGNTKSVKHD